MGIGSAFTPCCASVAVRHAMNILMCLHVLACSGVAAAADRLAIPSEADQKAALTTIKDVFKTELAAAKSGAQLTDLAQKMLSNIQGEQASAANDYVLLTQAQALAIRGSNISLTMKIITTLGEKFDVDQQTLAVNAIRELAKGPADRDFHQQLANLAIRRALECRQDERLDLALQYMVQADAIASKLKSTELTKRSGTLKSEINDQKKLAEKRAEAEATLKSKPDDPGANDTLGRYLIVVKADWDEGLKHLVLSSDNDLRTAAQQDTAVIDASAIPAPDNVVKLADQWWDVAQKQASSGLKSAIKLRAGQWYAVALPGLKGLPKVKAEQRITESEFKAESAQVVLMPTNRADFAVDRAIFEGKGLITSNYAICQTLSYGQAKKLHATLEARKMRPMRFRPYPTPEGLKVAAIWARSSRPGTIFEGTGDEIEKRFELAIKEKMYPLDLAGYLTPDGQVRYVMLLTPSQYPEGTEFELTIGFPLKGGAPYGKSSGIAPTSRTFFQDSSGDSFVNVIWRKPKATFYYVRNNLATVEKAAQESKVPLVDVAVASYGNRMGYSFIAHKLEGAKSTHSIDATVNDSLALWKELATTRGTPVSVSVVVGPGDEYHSAWVWHMPE